MRRCSLFVIGALAFAGAAVATGAQAQVGQDPPPPSSTTTTSTPPVKPQPETTTTTAAPAPPRSTTTVKGATTTTTTAGATRSPVPPPASGASQPLDPSLLGGIPLVDLNPTTTTGVFSTESDLPPTTIFTTSDDNAITVAASGDGPSGATLALASLAWLASLGGLLVYAEDQRAKQWRHLAR